MLNNDQRRRLAEEARGVYTTTTVSLDPEGVRHDWLAVVDHLWAEFDRITTPRPRHDDDPAGLAARENASAPEPHLCADHLPDGPWDRLRKANAQVATLVGTVSGLRAELAATLRRLETAREATQEYQRAAVDAVLRLDRIRKALED